MRVLIVDDESSHREYLAEVVKGWGFDIQTAGDGEEALALMNNSSFDILLSDLMMPKMDGFELLRRLPIPALNASTLVIPSTPSGRGRAVASPRTRRPPTRTPSGADAVGGALGPGPPRRRSPRPVRSPAVRPSATTRSNSCFLSMK